uniref:Uncharacterized protein n=1 Tax=Oryza glumipatula TaxID=40148 RepID=A0A0E0ACN9_9ORYZ
MPRIGRWAEGEISSALSPHALPPRLVRYLPPFGLLLFDPTIFNFPNMTTIFNLLKIITCPYKTESIQSKSKC